jgi:hypothetical protein
MALRSLLLAVGVAGALSAALLTSAEKPIHESALRIEFDPAGNLQVGVPGTLLSEPITVRTQPGARVRFFSPDLGVIEETGAAEATVTADERGLAHVQVRLGANLGQYTVIASPAEGEGSEVVYTFRALRPEAMLEREAKLAAARKEGGAR